MNFRIALLLVISLLGVSFQANALLPVDPLPPDFDRSTDAVNTRWISIFDDGIERITSQDGYEKHLRNMIVQNYYTEAPLICAIITFADLGLLYGIPDQYRTRFQVHRTSDNAQCRELEKILDTLFSNIETRLFHKEEKLNLFDQTRDILTEAMNSTDPLIKWMAYRAVTRTAADEGKFDEANIFSAEALRDLPVLYKPNVEKMLHSLQTKHNNSAS
ncbi:MAG: hypothetical protein K2W94_04420 [Alphaproteobacteria bacterium]|nr:hypothetical protein [Alphaproteobacteria bacterium]